MTKKKNDTISFEIIDEKEPVLSTDKIPNNDLFEISKIENIGKKKEKSRNHRIKC